MNGSGTARHEHSGGGFYHYLYTGQDLLEKGEVREAREHFADALALKPDNPEALAGMALAAFKLNDFQPASEAYSKLIEFTPDQSTLHVNLGIVYLKMNRLDDAEASLEQALANGGDSPKIQNYLGLIYSKRGEYARALDAFRQSGSHKMAQQMEDALAKARGTGEIHVSATGAPPRKNDDVEILVNAEVDAAQTTESTAVPPAAAASQPETSTGVNSTDKMEFEDEDESSASAAPVPAEAPDPDAERRRNILKMGQRGPSAGITHVPSASEGVALSQLRTDAPRLKLPAPGAEPFAIAGGGLLRARLDAKICAKTHGAALVRGEITVSEPLYKKFKGRRTNVLFGEPSRPIHRLEGAGEILWSSGRELFHRLTLEGDKIFLNERVLFAFTASLAWENGRITTGDLEGIHLVNFTGRGDVILRIEGPMTVVELSGDQTLKVRADRLLGWRGRIAPRMEIAADGGLFAAETPVLHMQGEGNLFLGSA